MLANRLADVEQGDMFGDIVVTNQSEPVDPSQEAFAAGTISP
jgi:hypothetical protein